MTRNISKIKVGSRLSSSLTVLGILDDRGDEPLYLVWHHKYWCPMLCKVLKSQQAAQSEADILGTLAHPNIVRCLGTDGSALLMEYLEGPNLHRLLQSRSKQRLDINDALRASLYIGAALSHVHDRGLIHLDVKPANIVVVGGRPVLCDFGIARWQDTPRPSGTRGTEGYIAPEEWLCKEITPAADIFGLGVTLYELLAGRLPFPEGWDVKHHPQIFRAPTPIRVYRRSVPTGLEKLVLTCLAHDPAERPKLEELLPSLHGFISRGPSVWPPDFNPTFE